MARRTAPKPAAAEAPAPASERKALIPDGSWSTVVVVDAEVKPTRAGEPRASLQLEVVRPRAYAGRTLYFSTQPSLDKTQAALDKEFPELAGSWHDHNRIWDELGTKELRAHVYSDPERVDPDTKQVYPARNRVSSLWKPKVKA